MVRPYWVWLTSGWNCTAYSLRSGEALRCLRDVIGVAHPGDCLRRQLLVLEQCARFVVDGLGLAVLRCGAGGDRSAEGVCHQLTAVADAEDRDAHLKDFLGNVGGFFVIDAVRTAGEDDARRFPCGDFFQGCGIADDFAVDTAFPHTPCDKLIVLTAEVQYQNQLIFHRFRILSVQGARFLLLCHFFSKKASTFYESTKKAGTHSRWTAVSAIYVVFSCCKRAMWGCRRWISCCSGDAHCSASRISSGRSAERK